VCLRHVETNSLQDVRRMVVIGRCDIEVSELPLTHGQIQEAAVAWGRGKIKGHDVLPAGVEDESGRGQLNLRFGDGHDRVLKDTPLESPTAE
jgi:hypothetical protein